MIGIGWAHLSGAPDGLRTREVGVVVEWGETFRKIVVIGLGELSMSYASRDLVIGSLRGLGP